MNDHTPMKITVTKKDNTVSIDLENEISGNDMNINTTPENARILAEKILAALALS